MAAIANIRRRYSSLSVQARATMWFVACSFMQRGITMITTPFFTRFMNLEEYGAVNTFTAWQQMLTLVCTLTLSRALMNLYVKRKDWERVLSAVTTLSIVSAVIWLAACLIFLDQVSELLGMSKTLTVCMFTLLVGQGAIDCWSLHQRYLYKYKKMIAVTLVLTVLTAVAGLLGVVFIAPTAELRIIPMAAVNLIVGIALYGGIIAKGRCLFDRSAWVFALSFCIPLMPHYLSEFVLNSSDRLMINYMCGSSEVALYSVAGSVAGLIGVLTSAINSSYAPYTYQKIASGETRELAKTANSILIMVAGVLLLIEFFGAEIVWVFGGSKYAESVSLIAPLCFGAYFCYLFQSFARIQEYYVRRLEVVVPSVLCAILNIVLNLALIPVLGFQVAAWTTASSYLVFCILHYLFYRQLCKREGVSVYDVEGMLKISLLYIALSAIVMLVGVWLPLKYGCLAISLLVAFAKRRDLKKAIAGVIGRIRTVA